MIAINDLTTATIDALARRWEQLKDSYSGLDQRGRGAMHAATALLAKYPGGERSDINRGPFDRAP